MRKLAGAALILLSAGTWCLLRRREDREVLALARALLEDLAVLDSRVRLCRTPLPELLESLEGTGADMFWRPLLERLERAEGDTLSQCWTAAAAELPEALARILAPLGALLSVGGARLDKAVEETREELTGFLREETVRQADQGRVHAALCLSGACLAVLVLL
ncbi:MAG: stage III sporulation protein AB [Oscillospiraceae bacterium]|nr:stage III sporulation protein AB [Oscillospiraceae bacterium]